MIAIPAASDCSALSKIASSPSSTSRPSSGRWTPARILTSVDFPAPFSPTRPWTSPPWSSMSPSSRARTAPKLFCACSSESMGPEGDVVTIVAEAGAARSGAPPPVLEVEVVDVLDGERERRSENHLRPLVRAPDDVVLAELSGRERLADLARDLAVGKRRDRVPREVAEVPRIPELERRDGVVMDVLLHLARQAEACEHDLLLVLGGGEVLRRRRDAYGRRRLDPLQVRVRLQHAHGRLPRLSRVVVAVVR